MSSLQSIFENTKQMFLNMYELMIEIFGSKSAQNKSMLFSEENKYNKNEKTKSQELSHRKNFASRESGATIL